MQEISAVLSHNTTCGKTVLVTAGPTREFIDAVRFISNPSTGKMGYALAAAARTGGRSDPDFRPHQLASPWGVTMVPVVSARTCIVR